MAPHRDVQGEAFALLATNNSVILSVAKTEQLLFLNIGQLKTCETGYLDTSTQK